jgi:hypothetical protein
LLAFELRWFTDVCKDIIETSEIKNCEIRSRILEMEVLMKQEREKEENFLKETGNTLLEEIRKLKVGLENERKVSCFYFFIVVVVVVVVVLL